MSVAPRTADLKELSRIARAAADVVMEVYATAFSVEMKGPGDPVTLADKRANDLLCEQIATSFPGVAIVAEEDAPRTPEALRALVTRESVFFVDPLDGTREFATRCPEFSVMIGLAEHGRASLGVLVLPTTHEVLLGDARAPGTAVFTDKDGVESPLRVTGIDETPRARVVVSRSRRPRFVDTMHERLKFAAITPCGSVGVKIARVAMAEADIYVHGGGGIKSWDLCGPEAVLWAAGGQATTLDGDPVNYAGDLVHARGFVGTNKVLHDTIVRTIRDVSPA